MIDGEPVSDGHARWVTGPNVQQNALAKPLRQHVDEMDTKHPFRKYSTAWTGDQIPLVTFCLCNGRLVSTPTLPLIPVILWISISIATKMEAEIYPGSDQKKITKASIYRSNWTFRIGRVHPPSTRGKSLLHAFRKFPCHKAYPFG